MMEAPKMLGLNPLQSSLHLEQNSKWKLLQKVAAWLPPQTKEPFYNNF